MQLRKLLFGVALLAIPAFGQITPPPGSGTFVQLSGDASSTATGGATVVNGLKGVPFCTGYTPTNGQAVTYTTGGAPNPCYTAATGSGGTPGGSNTQFQYNNSSAFGGDTAFTTDGAGHLADSANGAASTAALTLSGTPFSGSGTTSVPLFYLDAGTAPTTFFTGGTYLGVNAASGFAGNFVDFHINGGASVFGINTNGIYAQNGSASGPSYSFQSSTGSGLCQFQAGFRTLLRLEQRAVSICLASIPHLR